MDQGWIKIFWLRSQIDNTDTNHQDTSWSGDMTSSILSEVLSFLCLLQTLTLSKNKPYLFVGSKAFNVGGGYVKKVKLYNIHSTPRIKPILSIENPFKELPIWVEYI